MMIWDIRAAGQSPQHIGNYDGLGSLKELLVAGRAARHPMKIAAVATKGNKATCYTFNAMADYLRFFGNNPDLNVTDKAINAA